MSDFVAYWNAYPTEAEAKADSKVDWSVPAVEAGIVGNAIRGLHGSVAAELDHLAANELQSIGDHLVGIPMPVEFEGIRCSFIGIEQQDGTSPPDLVREILDRARESLCFVVLPSTSLSVWPIPGEEQQVGAASVIPLYPGDVDAVALGEIGLIDLFEWKLHRRLILGKRDPETQYEKRLVQGFLERSPGGEPTLADLDAVLRAIPDHASAWLEHPLLSRVQSTVSRGRGCLLVGPSSSGKSVLALQVGRSFLLGGSAVRYVNLSRSDGMPRPLFREVFHTSRNGIRNLIIIDDLQSNPGIARYALSMATTAGRVCVGSPPSILAVSWIDYSRSAAAWFSDCLLIAVRPFQLRERLAVRYKGAISEPAFAKILDTFGEDLFLLRLALEQSKGRACPVGAEELAEHIWQSRRAKNAPPAESSRVGLVVGSLGRFDIPTPPGFLKRAASVDDKIIASLLSSGLIRRHGDNLSMGHRSLCGLLADWLASSGVWRDLDERGGPRNTGSLVLDYLRALGSSLAVDTLRALHARAGFKDRPRLNGRAAALVELWEAFNAVLERIEHQQSLDATWGSVPSSAMFAVAAFSEVGKAAAAADSLAFLRKHWGIENGRLYVSTAGLATAADFTEIKAAMMEEDQARDDTGGAREAEDVDPERFHRTFVIGLLLCAESSYGGDHHTIEALGRAAEQEQLPTGAFYPARVPWCTARVLLGLAACGRTVETSKAVINAVDWLLRDSRNGGACSGGLWHGGTGRWNSTLETTGMVLLALAAVGFDCSDARIQGARAYLLSQRHRWTAPGKELDGALAIQAYLDTGGAWEEVAAEAQGLSQWAKGEAFWHGATRSATESLGQSCRVAQIASHLISIGWTAIRSDLPGFLDALATPDLLGQQSRERGELPFPESPPQAETDIEDHAVAVDPELDALRRLARISLGECTVVGAYRRFEERTRNKLRDWKGRIESALIEPTQAHSNFLIWAAPGSGKSFLVQEIARELGDAIAYFDINLARLSRKDFCDRLTEVQGSQKPVLCLLDEIDARANETWPYEVCFSLLDLNLNESRRTVFVLIGSDSAGMAGMVEEIKARQKGTDMLDRVPVGNRFEIPPLSLEDRAVVVASQVAEAATARGHAIREIEKLALYYAVKNRDLRTPRQLRDLAVAATQRVAGDDDRLKYDDLFHRGDRRNQEFWVDHPEAAGELASTFIQLQP